MLQARSLIKRKCDDNIDDERTTKSHRPPPSPPQSFACDQLTGSPPRTSSAYARALATAAWVNETATVAMPPKSQPDTTSSDVLAASSFASSASSRSRTTQTKAYRGLIRKAGIIPETWRAVPSHVQAVLDDALSDALPPALDEHIPRIASRFCERTRELIEDDANEAAWKTAFSSMLEELRLECGGGAEIKIASDQEWCDEVLPQPRLLAPAATIPLRRSQDGFAIPVLHASPRSPISLKKPRPDSQLSLAARALASRVDADLLDQWFDAAGLIANPSRQPESGFFPFLICELKSSATGGNLYGAQNQACVAAAAALRIFAGLRALDPSGGADDFRAPVFAICSESARFELFAYWHEPGQARYVGKGVRQWKSFDQVDALDMARCLTTIMLWARGTLKTTIVRAIDAMWEASHDQPSPDQA